MSILSTTGVNEDRVCGAEGGTQSNTLFLAVLQGFFNFLRKTALFHLRTHRTSRTLRTWLYLSCSELVPHVRNCTSADFCIGTNLISCLDYDDQILISVQATPSKTTSNYTAISHIRHVPLIRHDRCSTPQSLAHWRRLLPIPHTSLIRMRGMTMAAKEFTRIPADPKELEEFERQYMTPKELAQRWRVSESAIHHRKAGSNNLPRYYFGRAVRFIRQDVYDFENQKTPTSVIA